MRISLLLDNLLDDLDILNPISLSQIIWFIKSHRHFNQICMLVHNSSKSAKYLYDQCVNLDTEENLADLQLAALIVIIGEVEITRSCSMYDTLVSRVSKNIGTNHWSRGMAISYLLSKEVNCETICKSA
jgi:hypothetical protein